MEETLALSRHARHVSLIHRRSSFRCAPVMLERVRARANVELVTGSDVTALHADPSGHLERLSVRSVASGAARDLAVQGLFVAIGHTPRSELAGDALPCSATAHLLAAGPGGATRLPGVFVAGDVTDDRFRQAVTAAGAGCAAALETQRYLEVTHA